LTKQNDLSERDAIVWQLASRYSLFAV